MVRFVLLALAGTVVWYGWNMLRRQQKRVARVLREVEESCGDKEPIVLEKDPDTGIYRPAERRD